MKIENYRLQIRWIAFALVTLLAGCGEGRAAIVDGPYVEPAGKDQVVVAWETDGRGDSWVEYGPTPAFGARVGTQDAVTSHRVALSGLRPGERYFYRVRSGALGRNGEPFTAGVQFRKGPYLQNVTPSGIVFVWETASPAVTKVAYGTGGVRADTVRPGGAQVFQEVALAGLKPGARYRGRVFADGVSSPEVGFRTPAPGDTAFSFLVYGDSRGDAKAHGALVAKMAAHDFDLALHSGDFVDDGQREELWEPQFFEPIRPLGLRGPIYPALGNHDKDAPAYYRFFSTPSNGSVRRPEAWYSFDYGSAHFVVLDSNRGASERFAAGSEQLLYLEEDLKASKAAWKFVMFHHPLYSSARHKSDLELQGILMPLFERYGVDLILTGHDHNYERTWPLREGRRHDDGVVHVVSGGGGAELYPSGRSDWTACSESSFHYCLVQVAGARLDLNVFDVEGNRIDVLTLHKDRAVLEGLLGEVKGSDPARRLEAVKELGRTGRLEAAPALALLAEAGEVDLRRAVAEALARVGSREGVGALTGLSGDADAEARRWAMRGLIDLGGADASKTCLERLADVDAEVRRTAARGLRRTPLPEAVPAVVKMLRDEEDARVRAEVLLALEAAGGEAAGEAVVARLRDQELAVRRTAFEIVVRMGLQRPALPALIDLLGQEEPRMRRDLIIAIGDARDTTALPALMQALRTDRETAVRQVAANALLKLKDPRATEALIRALDDPDRRVHPFAMRALTVITRELWGEDREAWKRWWEEQGKQGRR